MGRWRREASVKIAYIVETAKLTLFGVSAVLLMLHPVILLCLLLNLVEEGNVLQNVCLLLLWLSDLVIVALVAFAVDFIRTRRSLVS